MYHEKENKSKYKHCISLPTSKVDSSNNNIIKSYTSSNKNLTNVKLVARRLLIQFNVWSALRPETAVDFEMTLVANKTFNQVSCPLLFSLYCSLVYFVAEVNQHWSKTGPY